MVQTEEREIKSHVILVILKIILVILKIKSNVLNFCILRVFKNLMGVSKSLTKSENLGKKCVCVQGGGGSSLAAHLKIIRDAEVNRQMM